MPAAVAAAAVDDDDVVVDNGDVDIDEDDVDIGVTPLASLLVSVVVEYCCVNAVVKVYKFKNVKNKEITVKVSSHHHFSTTRSRTHC
jgi:hypothetical protein